MLQSRALSCCHFTGWGEFACGVWPAQVILGPELEAEQRFLSPTVGSVTDLSA